MSARTTPAALTSSEATVAPVAPLAREVERSAPAMAVAQSTRRILQPLVGIDPQSVPVHRGAAADALAASHAADAVAAEGEIMMGAAHAESSPEGLALLAHELVHVSRERAPDHVPPIARAARARTSAHAIRPAGDDEERTALDVEARVRDVARGRSPRTPALGSAPDDAALPAPWEPIPELHRDPSSSRASASAPVSASATSAPARVATSTPAASAAPAAQTAAPAVRAASRSRTFDAPSDAREPQSSPSPSPSPDAASAVGAERGSPTPVVDALARQVYDVLKRRLAAERRRGA